MMLFDKGQIGQLRLKNRIIMSPMNVGGNNDTDGCLSERGINYFVERAKGGAGMIVTGAVRVTRKLERDNNVSPVWMLFADHMVHGKWISELAERCHDYGTKLCVQLTAGGGRFAGRYAQEHGLAIGPSAIPCLQAPHAMTREMTRDEILHLVQSFEQAARLIKNAGADAIQIHGHQGYLIDQFTTSLWNHRTDEYGGSLENRLRFSRELIEAIKRGTGQDFPVIYRYGLTHYLDGGRNIEEGQEMAKLLELYGVDALDIDSGCKDNNYYPHPPTTIKCGTFAYLAEKVKEVVSIPVITSTRIGYPEIAEDILSSGKADFVSIGRPLIADPYWPQKAQNGDNQNIRPCLACHEGCLKRLGFYKSLSCAVNPVAGNESYLNFSKSEKKLQVAVVGGGIAGMVAAITCAERGHNVKLYEKDKSLGGNFKLELIPEFKDDYKRYVTYLVRKLERLSNVMIIMNCEANIKELSEYNDKVICAIGGEFRSLEINGLDRHDMVSPFSLYEKKNFSGEKIIIVGGGLIGIEAALNVSINGGNPIIIELSNHLARTAHAVNRDHLLLLLKEHNVPVYKLTKVVGVKERIILCEQEGKIISLPFDKISVCVGMMPKNNNEEFPDNVITIGDAEKVENIMNAVWTAYRRSRLI